MTASIALTVCAILFWIITLAGIGFLLQKPLWVSIVWFSILVLLCMFGVIAAGIAPAFFI